MPKTKTLSAKSDLVPIKPTEKTVSIVIGLIIAAVLMLVWFTSNRMQKVQEVANQKKLEEQKNAVALPTTYTVKEGDHLWSIATTYYNSGYNWVDLASTNNLANPDYIEVGQVLTIPLVKPIEVGQITATSTEKIKPKEETYTIRAGDTLWNIAEFEYGSGFYWTDIAAGNNLTNPDLIYAGNYLTLPSVILK